MLHLVKLFFVRFYCEVSCRLPSIFARHCFILLTTPMWYILETVQQSYDLSDRLIRAISHWQLADTDSDDVEDLLERGADVNKLHGTLLPLHCACMTGDTRVADLLLQHGAQVNTFDGYSRTPLHYAAECDDSSCVDLLLSAGAEVNARDGSGDTALHWASFRGAVNCVVTLLQQDAVIVDAVDLNRSTPLMWASKRPSAACIVELLLRNASPDAVDLDNKTALIHASLAPASVERDAAIILLLRASGHLEPMIRQARLPPGIAVDALAEYVGECRQLRQLCRHMIRRCLGQRHLPDVVPLLPLPPRLQNYLLLLS